MTEAWALAIDRNRLHNARIVPVAPAPLGPGQARLRIDRFALTGNNVTYAAFGDAMRYWDFFPGDKGFGRLPVWGFASVCESLCPGLAEGTRVFGFLPAASHLTVTPGNLQPAGFTDAAPHRADLPPVYNRYATDPVSDTPEHETARALFEPLFLTAVLLALHLRSIAEDMQVITVTAASSKTALALAAILRDDPLPGVTVEGLTSATNQDFVTRSGLYDRVACYDQAMLLPDGPARLIVDIAGSAPINRALHDRFHTRLVANIRVGGAHWADSAPARNLPGPRPRFFFAPDALREARHEGTAAFMARLDRARAAVAARTRSLITPRRLIGPGGALSGWHDLVANRVPPDTGLIVEV